MLPSGWMVSELASSEDDAGSHVGDALVFGQILLGLVIARRVQFHCGLPADQLEPGSSACRLQRAGFGMLSRCGLGIVFADHAIAAVIVDEHSGDRLVHLGRILRPQQRRRKTQTSDQQSCQ